MLNVVAEFAEPIRALSELPAMLDRQLPRLMGEIGQRMKERAREDFLVKSRGGTGAGGVRWAAVTPAEQRVKQHLGARGLGVRTGELLNSLTFTTSGSTSWGKPIAKGEVAIEFTDQPKANAFNAARELFPSRLPAAWYSQLDGMTQLFVEDITTGLFS